MPTFEAAFPLLVVGGTHFDRTKLYLILKSDKSNQNIEEHTNYKIYELGALPDRKNKSRPP
jgi:hypothetical protein